MKLILGKPQVLRIDGESGDLEVHCEPDGRVWLRVAYLAPGHDRLGLEPQSVRWLIEYLEPVKP